MTTPDHQSVLDGFALEGQIATARPQPGGLIHQSWRVEVEHHTARRPYLLQRLNTHVFPDVEAVMGNLASVSEHIARQLNAAGCEDTHRRCLTLVPSRSSENGLVYSHNAPWRLFHFIEGTISRTIVDNPDQAAAVGHAYGAFQRHLADYSGATLSLTIPHFHDTDRRFDALQLSAQRDIHGRRESSLPELRFAAENRHIARILPGLAQLPTRVVHNDAKPANVLFDELTGAGLTVIDLDTVMPGSALHDFGDMVRSSTSSAGGDRTTTEVDVDLALFGGLVAGYLAQAGPSLTAVEREHLAMAGVILSYEQGLRFLTDHLDGDVYFAGNPPGYNLGRCQNQFAFAAALQRRQVELQALASRA
ncbi:MAG: hypothetical protein ACI9EF_002777 [Pseudohongiellaceae bacterium]